MRSLRRSTKRSARYRFSEADGMSPETSPIGWLLVRRQSREGGCWRARVRCVARRRVRRLTGFLRTPRVDCT
jgi:hypothetical protein